MKIYVYCTIFLLFNAMFCIAQWTNNTSVNLEVAGLNVSDLQTATTSDGKTWIAFYTNNAGNYDMRAQLLDIGGNKLLGPDGVLVCDQTSGSGTFTFNICLDASNNLIIAFQYVVAGINTAVITKVTTNGSLPWGISGVQLGAGLSPYPTLLTTGETVVAWNNSSPSTLYIQKLSTSGNITWGAPVAVTVGVSNTTRGQIVANPGGYFTMVFQRRGVGISTTLYAQRYDNNGIPQWTLPVQISALTTSGARYYSIVSDADLTYFGYFASSGSRFFSYVQRINADGTLPWGGNGSVFSTYSTGVDPYQQTTNIAHEAGSSYVWAVCSYSNTSQNQYGVYVQKFNAVNGTVLLDPLGKEVYPISANSDIQSGRLSLTNDEPVFISYDLNYKIYATRLNGSGNFVWPGNRVEISATTAGGGTPKGRFSFTEFVNNQGVAVWYENRGIEYRAYAQQINSFGVIPVKLNGLIGIRNGKFIKLYWKTLSESNNKGFIIERSDDGINYTKLDFVSSRAIAGNSSTKLDYSFTDLQPLKYINYYRLNQVDIDDKNTYSNSVLVRNDAPETSLISHIYPIPATNFLHVSIESKLNLKGILNIVDMYGKTVQKTVIKINKGNNVFDLNIKSLANGIYLVKIISENSEIVSLKWLKE